MAFRVARTLGPLGAELAGIDASGPLDGTLAREIAHRTQLLSFEVH